MLGRNLHNRTERRNHQKYWLPLFCHQKFQVLFLTNMCRSLLRILVLEKSGYLADENFFDSSVPEISDD